jgi:hypothetical protein
MAPLPPPTSTTTQDPEKSWAARNAATCKVARRAIDALKIASSSGWAASHDHNVSPCSVSYTASPERIASPRCRQAVRFGATVCINARLRRPLGWSTRSTSPWGVAVYRPSSVATSSPRPTRTRNNRASVAGSDDVRVARSARLLGSSNASTTPSSHMARTLNDTQAPRTIQTTSSSAATPPPSRQRDMPGAEPTEQSPKHDTVDGPSCAMGYLITVA